MFQKFICSRNLFGHSSLWALIDHSLANSILHCIIENIDEEIFEKNSLFFHNPEAKAELDAFTLLFSFISQIVECLCPSLYYIYSCFHLPSTFLIQY